MQIGKCYNIACMSILSKYLNQIPRHSGPIGGNRETIKFFNYEKIVLQKIICDKFEI